ncbi:hypothetical protein SAMN05444004_107127 [Jannaschia faecimaris]|uniref:Uncharacterized protein n=1 Tax=Jannaschia faecimaris TaxID=1244108 RepID=A0A1H3R2S1_9RHOB|nr:hypothetical protein [Jannaschia faecimaris]SDZ19896.1 hypothetical protein SAMN05444004_107127 [Jannaschia faecimaris]
MHAFARRGQHETQDQHAPDPDQAKPCNSFIMPRFEPIVNRAECLTIIRAVQEGSIENAQKAAEDYGPATVSKQDRDAPAHAALFGAVFVRLFA